MRERLLASPERPYLFERSEEVDWDMTFEFAAVGMLAWLRESAFRPRSRSKIVQDAWVAASEGNLERFVLEGLEVIKEAELGKRAANSLRLALGEDAHNPGVESQWGRDLICAYEDPNVADHGAPHGRVVKAWVMAGLKEIPELRHTHSVVSMVRSMMDFPYSHDMAKAYWEYKNLAEERVSPTVGHNFAGANMKLALHTRYAQENGVRKRDAWRVEAFAAAMGLLHSEPEKFKERREAQGKTLTRNAGTLVGLWDENQLDVLSLTPAQTMRMGAYLRRGVGGDVDDPKLGLPRDFVREYGPEIGRLRNNHDPLIIELDDRDREAFWLAAELCVWADRMAMIAPYQNSVFRTFLSPQSKDRPLYPSGLTPGQVLEQVAAAKGDLVDGQDSDVRRKMFEIIDLDNFSPDSLVGKSDFVRLVHKDNAMLGALAFRRIAGAVMRGDLHEVNELYERRMTRVREKALRRSGYSLGEQVWYRNLAPHLFNLLSNGQDRYMRFMDGLIRAGSFDTERYELKLEKLKIERNSLLTILAKKRQPEELENCLEVIDGEIDWLRRHYGVNEREMRRYEQMVERWQSPSMQPYKDAESLGGEPHLLREPSEVAKRLFHFGSLASNHR
ncbi:MAG: hypothetical protein HYS86_02325 [Candidatus Chisholmbacteria bacterium]|nr:hypothetical protein [Candidatus Chisholmbacteria bacterium]